MFEKIKTVTKNEKDGRPKRPSPLLSSLHACIPISVYPGSTLRPSRTPLRKRFITFWERCRLLKKYRGRSFVLYKNPCYSYTIGQPNVCLSLANLEKKRQQ